MPSMNTSGRCGVLSPPGPPTEMREPVPATPLDRITLTPGRRAVNASESVRPAIDESAAESRTATEAAVDFNGIGAPPGTRVTLVLHVDDAGCCACDAPCNTSIAVPSRNARARI